MPELISPRGFHIAPTAISENFEYSRNKGDDDLTDLYRELLSHRNDTMIWEFRKQVVDHAMRLLGSRNLGVFVNAQMKNPYLYGVSLNFLNDSLYFALGNGQRRVSLRNWSGIMEVEPPKKPIDRHRKIDMANKASDITTDVLVSWWLSHDGGFEDFLRSLYLMFGKKS